jgi:hypothetical protein
MMQREINGWLVQRWPHQFAEKWIAFPLRVPADVKWPGLQFFPNEEAAVDFCRNGKEF